MTRKIVDFIQHPVVAAFLTLSVAPYAGAQSTLPPGEGREVVARMCGTGCHRIEVTIAQRKTDDAWAQVVDNMVTRGAKGTDREIDAVIRYLSRHFGRSAIGGADKPASASPRSTSGGVTPTPSPGPSSLSKVTVNPENEWRAYGQDPGGRRYSPLKEITSQNVASLQSAWTYETREAGDVTPTVTPAETSGRAGRGANAQGPSPVRVRRRLSQATPLVVGSVMYLTTPYDRVVALEPETGKEIWKLALQDVGSPGVRSLTFWPGDAQTSATLFVGTNQGFLVAIDAKTGKLASGFADGGRLNLREGIADKFPKAFYGLSSPPVVFKNLVITGSHVQEQPSLGPAGDVRAWNARTGQLVWTFHTVPRPGEPGHETWEGDSWKDRSGANVWGHMTVDVERGLVFLPLGCATYDYYGGDRKGANLYGSTLVALDAETGRLKWHFQTTHHDVWDYDLESAPVLIDVARNGRTTPAVAQMTKQGLLFILDRTTGAPIFGVEERPTPQDGFWQGEHPWPTQPFPVKPAPLARNNFGPDEMAKVTPAHFEYCSELLKKDGGLRTGGPYLPFGKQAALIFPGTLGGSNWHGASYDPQLGYLFVNTMNLGEVYRIEPNAEGVPMAQRWKFWNPDKFWPCQQPPWGELTAVDVNTGDIAWRVPLGEFAELKALGVPKTGVPNIGGSIVTAGGLVFVGGTVDNMFRAFDARTGKELWAIDVGAAAHAVPVTYQGRDRKQYVAVMVSGGGFLGDPIIPARLMVFSLSGPPMSEQ
jgi:quinoprotein glucose dehydrogenase